jgi:hypothetical protein
MELEVARPEGFEPPTFGFEVLYFMKEKKALITLQPSQPLLSILNLGNTRVSVFPEIEEFLVMLDGFGSYLTSLWERGS